MTGGGPPYAKVGRLVLYDIHDLDAWVAANTRHSTSEEASDPTSEEASDLGLEGRDYEEPETSVPFKRVMMSN